jgi:hypothetical protein
MPLAHDGSCNEQYDPIDIGKMLKERGCLRQWAFVSDSKDMVSGTRSSGSAFNRTCYDPGRPFSLRYGRAQGGVRTVVS